MPEDLGISAVAEPVEAVESVETTETPVEGTETVDDLGTPAEKEGLTEKTPAKGKLSLADVVKTKVEALKAIDPSLPAVMRTAAFELGGLYREFPGGLKEAVALKTTLGEYGGIEGLKESAETLDGMSALAKSFFDGKAEFVDNLLAESPAAFSQMMPVGLEKWRTTDPEMYDHVQARVLTQTLDGIKASETLAAVWRSMPNGDAKNAIEQLWNSLDGFRKTGEKAPERKTSPEEEKLTEREQKLAQREMEVSMKPVNTAGKAQIAEILEREMSQGYQWNATDQDVKDAVRDRLESELVKVLIKDQTFLKERDRLKARGDFDGLTKHIKNAQARILPGIVPRVAKLFAVKPKSAPATVNAGKKPPINVTNGRTDAAWERVTSQPSFKDMDTAAMGRDYEDMVMSNRAILKGGRKVTWQ